MIDKKFIDAIKIIYNKLDEIPFYIIGSTSMALQGMNVKPNDIDIAVSINQIDEVYNLMKEYVKNPIYEKEFPDGKSKICLTEINGVEVEFLGKTNDDKYYSRILDGMINSYNISGMNLHCISLKAEYEAISTYRPEKAEKIRTYLDN